MTCKQFLTRLDASDHDGLSAQYMDGLGHCTVMDRASLAHAETCPACAAALALADRTAALALVSPAVLERDLSTRIMTSLLFVPPPRRIMAMRAWLMAGIALIVSLLLLPFVHAYQHLHIALGSGFLIPLVLFFGLALSAYLLVFVGSHMLPAAAYLRKHHLYRF